MDPRMMVSSQNTIRFIKTQQLHLDGKTESMANYVHSDPDQDKEATPKFYRSLKTITV